MASNDDIRLKMTVNKMNVHRSTKLQTIAVKCIVRNLDSFIYPIASKTRNVKLLPSALRNIIFQQWLMRQFAELKIPKYQNCSKLFDCCFKLFEKRMQIFQSLVSCHTLEVDFTPLMREISFFYARELLSNFLELIETNATNLKVLIVKECISMNGAELNVTTCNAIAMCKNLGSLTHLYTKIVFNPNFDESNQREIEDLQIFSNLIVFDHGCSFDDDNNFTINCIQRLPKLQSFGSRLTTSIIEMLLDRCPNQKFALTEMKLTAQTNKEIHLSFPDVTNLQVTFPYCDSDDDDDDDGDDSNNDDFINLNSLLKFSKIENLTLRAFPSVDNLIPFLDAYGHGLNSLKIIDCHGHFKLSSVLDRCPKLESFFSECLFILLPECSRPDIHFFSTGLKELDLKFPRFSDDDCAQLLLDILSVPTLERVALRMGFEFFHVEDIEKLTAMIASRQILRNLKRLSIFVFDIDSDNNQHAFRVLSDFIKSASAFLPHLTDLKTNNFSKFLGEMNSEASLEVKTLKKIVEVYENL
ncbi:Hypothetical predicted protein [Cloeon dipterum]|uniref:Uncharacterized protein n=1 Tax=Cloeon dipterum TaxID=197152 RepID=A0A8S1D280_9INSE|nr:Hypothetical predicted protein [Cloeon dipterum]